MKSLKACFRLAAFIAISCAGSSLFGAEIPGIVNSGVDDQGTPLADGAVDPHFVLVENPDSGSSEAIAASEIPSPPWVANSDTSRWIAARDGSGGVPGEYVYRLYLDLTGFNPDTAFVDGLWAMDDGATIRLNGQDTGVSASGFTELKVFTVESGFVEGLNELDFVVSNGGSEANPTGLRVELFGEATTIPAGTPLEFVSQPAAQSAREGGSATFKVVAQGSAPVTYEWRHDGEVIENADRAVLRLDNLTPELAGDYTVEVSNSVNSITSDPAALTVLPPQEFEVNRVAGVTVEGIVGRSYRLEFMDNLAGSSWSEVNTVTLTNSTQLIVDPQSAGIGQRFYRAELQPADE